MANRYDIKKITDTHYRLVEDGVNMELLIGNERALLIDTAFGLGNLPKAIAAITDKPVIVANTHGHPDHSVGNWQFDEVWVHPDDFATASMYDCPEARAKAIPEEKADDYIEAYANAPTSHMVACEEGHVFDLGNRLIEVVALPGHTAGSIGFMDRETRELFLGDAANSAMFLFQAGVSQPLSTYIATLKKIQSLPVDVLWLGHDPVPMNKDHAIASYIECAESVDYENATPLGDMLGTPDVRLWVKPAVRHLVDESNPLKSVYFDGLVSQDGFDAIFISKETM